MQTTVNPEAPQGDQPTTLFPNSAKAKSASADAASISTQSNPIQLRKRLPGQLLVLNRIRPIRTLSYLVAG